METTVIGCRQRLGCRFMMHVGMALLVWTSVSAWAGDPPVSHVFLIQNSGWMEPFFADAKSEFRPLIRSVIDKLQAGSGEVIVASFNQSVGDNRSPLLAYKGSDLSAAHRAVDAIQLVRKSGGGAFADTDFKEAIVGAITEFSPGRPCILWIFTNNKNSPRNSPETAAKNKEFYGWLQSESNIKRIVAYPIRMPVKGAHYQANGMMIYALAYGDPADTALQGLIAAKLPVAEAPARLKPLNADAVTFVPSGVARQSSVTAFLGPDRNTLILQFDSSSKPEMAMLAGAFRNDFNPYDIQSADVSLDVKFHGDSHGIRTAIEPDHITDIPAGGQSIDLAVKIGVPPLPSIWSHPEIIFKSGYQARGEMVFNLAEQTLRISPAFMKRMTELFPGDPLPEIFVPGDSAKQSATVRPLVVKVQYPVWPLIVLSLLVLFLVVGGFWLASVMTRPRKYTVTVNGMQKSYALRAFGRSALYSDQGEKIGELRRGLGVPSVRLDEGRSDQVRVI